MTDVEGGGKMDETGHSTLDIRDDPFAPRDGKTLTWKNIQMTLAAKGEEPERKLLQDVWGEVPQKETTAIMGPSGAGKTSLLNILAGRAASRGRLHISADIRLNNYEVDPTRLDVRRQIAFVAQDDSLQVTATPREAIRFSAKLRLARATTDSQLDKLTERMLEELGLTKCADTIVGGALIKGISGGERKRTSVGVELVTKPALVFLDEPTSGLDSFSAVQLCQVLKKVANAGASVLFTIHQPASEIFNSFDHLILMNKGRVMYQGAVSAVPDYFAEHGHPNPKNYNPADWIMNVAQSVNVEDLDAAGFFPKDTRPVEEAFAAGDSSQHDALGITQHEDDIVDDDTPVSMFVETSLLFQRNLVDKKRDTVSLITNYASTTFMAVLIGVIFLDVGDTSNDDQGNVQSRFGALIICLMMGMFGTAQDALLSFPRERPVFLREYSTNHYSAISYFLSKFTMEIITVFLSMLLFITISYFLVDFQMKFWEYLFTTYCLALSSTALAVMLGSAVEDPKLASEMLPLLFVPQMLFAGFFVATDLIPIWLRWAQYLCTLTYAVRIISIAEFEACKDPGAQNCLDIIYGTLDADPDDTWWYWLVLICIFVVTRCLGLAILTKKASKFL
mmetsp:Transcript_28344/g.65732  ORF Transcript_28344/g.65732 Transcript_28344/m.65732 type:complete len:620 (-) Transcript_28344:852-2711(-)